MELRSEGGASFLWAPQDVTFESLRAKKWIISVSLVSAHGTVTNPLNTRQTPISVKATLLNVQGLNVRGNPPRWAVYCFSQRKFQEHDSGGDCIGLGEGQSVVCMRCFVQIHKL